MYYNNVVSKKDSNKFVLSKGHGEIILFSILADLNFFSLNKLLNHYRSGDVYLGGHISHKINGIEFSTGSLGHGLSYSCGLAHAFKLKKKIKNKIFCLCGDAEINEGSVWEAAIYAGQRKLNNLVALVDYNKIGSSDFVKNYISNKCLAKAWVNFGWKVIDADGHNFNSIHKAFRKLEKQSKPTAIILNTVKGKGLDFMEHSPIWHVKGLDRELYLRAKKVIKGINAFKRSIFFETL